MKMDQSLWTRRALLGAVGAGASAIVMNSAQSDTRPQVSVWKDPNCGCCSGWVQHLRRNGFDVSATDTTDMQAIKNRLGVPQDLVSCHTATVAGYTIEGHVPAIAIRQLIADKPKARGIAVPGMPIGSPGMEGGAPEIYDVILFGDGSSRRFGRFRNDKPI